MTEEPRLRLVATIDGEDVEEEWTQAELTWDGDVRADLSDNEWLDRVSERLAMAPGSLGHLKVTRPSTGHIVVTRAFEYG